MRAVSAPAAAALLLVGLGGPGPGADRAVAQDEAPGANALEALDRAVRAVVDRAAPSVVRVEAERNVRLQVVVQAEEERRRLEEVLRRSPPRESVMAAGFLVDDAGLVLTTSAVAGGSTTIRVHFPRGEEREGEILGEDALAGVALVRIAPVEGVRALRFSTRKARPGSVSLFLAPEGVDAPGLHLGFVTSARRAFGLYDVWLVSSVPMGAGQAGAPLLDAAGDVLGMAVAPRIAMTIRAYSPGLPGAPGFTRPSVEPAISGETQNLGRMIEQSRTIESGPGFSTFVPAAELVRIAADLRALGRVRQGLLGVRMKGGEPVVREVYADLPAAGAGILPGDSLLALDGTPVATAEEVTGFVRRRAPGTSVKVRVRSPGRPEREATVVLAERPAPVVARALFNGLGVSATGEVDLSAAKFSTEIVDGGAFVVVRTVAEDSAAARAGLQPGDWIVEIAGKPLLGEKDFTDAATGPAASETSVEVLVYRPGEAERRRVVLK